MSTNSDVAALVLAAGKGTRMKSPKPKVLQELLGQSLIWYVYNSLEEVVETDHIWTVVGYESDYLYTMYPQKNQKFVKQDRQLGTGHAFQCAYPSLRAHGYSWCIVVNGDTPLVPSGSIAALLDKAKIENADCAFITMVLDDPSGYGRVIRDQEGYVVRVIEEKDLNRFNSSNSQFHEVNAGIYCFNMDNMGVFLDLLSNDNEQEEYYLPQLLEICRAHHGHVSALTREKAVDFLGINNPKELYQCEELMQWRILDYHLQNGAILHNPSSIRIGPEVECASGVEITGPVELYGRCILASESCIESNVWIKNASIGLGTKIHPFCHIEEAEIGNYCQVGPFARLRSGSRLEEGSKAGNFVEIKKAILGKNSKANHLSYIGDAQIGEETNVGAGTITCNYDGKQKHKTYIGNHAFIGSNCALVAPVCIGDGAVVGAGSTITKDVPEDMLSVTRSKQRNLAWKRRGS